MKQKYFVKDSEPPTHVQNDMGMIARNPKNHKDQWYVAKQYYLDNFEEIVNVDLETAYGSFTAISVCQPIRSKV